MSGRASSAMAGIAIGWLMAFLLALLTPLARAADAGAPAVAPKPDPEAAAAFILGNTVFVLLHELGHAVIRDFNVPILGLEESSADTIAAMTLIRRERATARGGGAADFASQLAIMAAVGNSLTWKSGVERQNPDLIYWAQHDISARRAARIACLLVGSERKRFDWLVESGLVPEIRSENCVDEYAVAEHAVEWVAQTYGRFKGGRGTDDGREISIDYRDTRTPSQARILEKLRAARVVETVVGYYDAVFRFPQPLTIKLSGCGRPNAYWDEGLRQLHFCYELLDTFEKYSADPAVTQAYEVLRRHSEPQLQSAPSPIRGEGESK